MLAMHYVELHIVESFNNITQHYICIISKQKLNHQTLQRHLFYRQSFG